MSHGGGGGRGGRGGRGRGRFFRGRRFFGGRTFFWPGYYNQNWYYWYYLQQLAALQRAQALQAQQVVYAPQDANVSELSNAIEQLAAEVDQLQDLLAQQKVQTTTGQVVPAVGARVYRVAVPGGYDSLNVRAAPSPNSELLGSLANGTVIIATQLDIPEMSMMGMSGYCPTCRWAQIIIPGTGGREAFVRMTGPMGESNLARAGGLHRARPLPMPATMGFAG